MLADASAPMRAGQTSSGHWGGGGGGVFVCEKCMHQDHEGSAGEIAWCEGTCVRDVCIEDMVLDDISPNYRSKGAHAHNMQS